MSLCSLSKLLTDSVDLLHGMIQGVGGGKVHLGIPRYRNTIQGCLNEAP